MVGAGYSGRAVARAAIARGMQVRLTSRGAAGGDGPALIPFAGMAAALAEATHLLTTAPPGEAGDPVLAAFADAVTQAPGLHWIGYLSTTGVYGDRQGGTVDEATAPVPTAARSVRRLAAETAWRAAAAGRPLDIIRLAGIYGPGRSAFDALRAGTAQRILRPGHAFGRIHADDIAGGVLAAMVHPPAGARVLNFSDDEPAESAAVMEEAARLLAVPPPPAVPFETAVAGMGEMARSFWAESRRVSSQATQAALARRWQYPSYREGLRAILASEADQGAYRLGQ